MSGAGAVPVPDERGSPDGGGPSGGGTGLGDGGADPAAYHAAGWWGKETLADAVRRNRAERPDGTAFVAGGSRMGWATYDDASDRLAGALIGAGFRPRSRIAVLVPDGATPHAVYLAAEKAGVVVVGIGPRAGRREIAHLLETAQAEAIVTHEAMRGRPAGEIVDGLRNRGSPRLRHVVVGDVATDPRAPFLLDGEEVALPPEGEAAGAIARRRLGADELFLLNSTSGTTGLPKCVMHNQNRWMYFHRLAVEAGGLSRTDVFMSALSAPFGFGLWTAHFTPTLLGSPVVLMERFEPLAALEAIERERVTVLACVSTQFIMMLACPELGRFDLGPLRAIFTGGEAVPYEQAASFEARTGASVLQFYGSNETGALSRTCVGDDLSQRLTTAGRVIPAMNVRLYEDGRDVTAGGGPAEAACRGPACCLGYYRDEEADSRLRTADGWMLTGDLVELDPGGWLKVVGRVSDIIIRGGKNVSAAALEEEVLTHPAVAVAAAVAMPDPVFGERVCLYAELVAGAVLDLEALTAHLESRGVTKEWFPERLVVLPELPRSSGGKIAKAQLRADISERLAEEAAAPG